MVSIRQILAIISTAVPACLAATATCDPLTASTCTADAALSSSTFTSDWTSSSSDDGWTTTAGSIKYGNNGAEFIINKEGDAPTIQSDFYIFFGKLEVKMKAAAGTGIVSSIVLLSDVNDEIDWEFTGGDTTQTQTNYFGKGNTTTYDRAIWYDVSTPQTTSHTYTIDWTSKAITWYIDGTAVRTLNYADANGGSNYPQTPCKIRLGIWAGGDSSNEEGTIEWAGGLTDFSQAPFTMYVESVTAENYSPGSSYKYTDETGDMDSIDVVSGSIAATATASSSAGVLAESGMSSTTASATSTVAAGTTKASSASVSIPTTISSSVESSALTTIPLASTNGTSGTGTDGTAAASTASGNISASGTVVNSSDVAVVRRGGNALEAFVLFVLAALCVL